MTQKVNEYSLIILMVFLMGFIFAGCELNIPEGMGKVVIDNEQSDFYTIVKVEYSKDGRDWTSCWHEGDSNSTLNQPNIYLEPGSYYFFVLAYFYSFRNPVYSDYKIKVKEGECVFLSFDGNRLKQN